MLQELTHLTKRLVTIGTVIRKVGYACKVVGLVRQERSIRHEAIHLRFSRRKSVDLCTGIFAAKTLRAVATFYVLNGVGTRPKALFAANRTGNVAGSMDLGVHLEAVATRELATTLGAVVGTIHTVTTAGMTIAFEPLVVAKAFGCIKTLAFGAVASVVADATATTEDTVDAT
jgi:hypothetical protein